MKNLLLKINFVVICCFLVSCKNIFIKHDITKIVNDMADGKVLTSKSVGISGKRSEQWDRYIELEENATDQQLIDLTDYNNPVVRCYAFQALANRENINLMPILVKHLRDNETLETCYGCIVSSTIVCDFFLDIAYHFHSKKCLLNEKQRAIIDSIMIFDKSFNKSRTYTLRNLKPLEKYYNRLREIMLEDKDANGLIALSKYHKQQDKELIIDKLKSKDTRNLFYGLSSVKNFPDSSFFPYLQSIHQDARYELYFIDFPTLSMLYQAIVQYKDSLALEMLQLTLSNSSGFHGRYHLEYMDLALKKYPNNFFKDIQNQIKLPDWQEREVDLFQEDDDNYDIQY